MWLDCRYQSRVFGESNLWQRTRHMCSCWIWLEKGSPGRWQWLRFQSYDCCNDCNEGYGNNGSPTYWMVVRKSTVRHVLGSIDVED